MRTLNSAFYWKLIGVIIAFCSIYAGYVSYSNLQKGLIFNDEAYYLFPFKNRGEMLLFDRTNYYRIFKFLYTDNLYHFRIITLSLLALSHFILAYFSALFFKSKIPPILFAFIGSLSAFFTWDSTNIAMEQYISNPILLNFSLTGIILYFLTKKYAYLGFSGFFLGFILFNGNSHAIIIFPVFALALWGMFAKQWKQKIPYLLGGMFLAIILYFTFMDTLSNYIEQWRFLKEYLHYHQKQHSKAFFLQWVVKVLTYTLIPTVIYIAIIVKKVPFNRRKKWVDYTIVGVFILFLCDLIWKFLPMNIVFIFLSHIVVFRFWLSDKPLVQKLILLAFLILPYGLCFGSMTYFHIRAREYLYLYYLSNLLVITSLYSYQYSLIVGAVLLFKTFTFPQYQYKKGWKDFIFADQNTSVQVNGNTLLLDTKKAHNVELLRPYLKNQHNVIYAQNQLLGYLYITDAFPPINYYFTNMEYLDYILKRKGVSKDSVIYFESKRYPFSNHEKLPMEFVDNPTHYRIEKVGEFTLYLPKNYKQK